MSHPEYPKPPPNPLSKGLILNRIPWTYIRHQANLEWKSETPVWPASFCILDAKDHTNRVSSSNSRRAMTQKFWPRRVKFRGYARGFEGPVLYVLCDYYMDWLIWQFWVVHYSWGSIISNETSDSVIKLCCNMNPWIVRSPKRPAAKSFLHCQRQTRLVTVGCEEHSLDMANNKTTKKPPWWNAPPHQIRYTSLSRKPDSLWTRT